MTEIWENFLYKLFLYAPCILVCFSFLPCGLVYGYTISAFMAARNLDITLIGYGPMILAGCSGLIIALAMVTVKYLRSRIAFCHINILLAASVLHFIASFFYFVKDYDNVGSFISYLAHSFTITIGLSFLHSMADKNSRALLIAICFSFYILGLATSASLIATSFATEEQDNITAVKNKSNKSTESIVVVNYVEFAGVYLAIAILTLALFIGLKILNYLGSVDYANSMDNDLRVANSNGSIFDKRDEVIKRIQFFYVTKNQQWNITLLLIFTEAIQYSLFIYFTFWFVLSSAIRLTVLVDIDLMFWCIFLGTLISILLLRFFSAKFLFVGNQLLLIVLTILAMIICNSVKTSIPFWLIILCFGINYSNLQIILVEVAHFRYNELVIYASYALKLLATGMIYYYFVSNEKNSYFYSTDISTLMSQGFVFIIIVSLLALVVGMKVPRTYRTSLFEIQYSLLGIIFQKHQIEQLNVRCLNDGTIPTISN